MGLLDKLKGLGGKAKKVTDKQGDKIADGVDKATDFVDEKTGGKYTDKLEKIDELADKHLGGGDSDSESESDTPDSA